MKVTGGAAELGLGLSKTGTMDEEVLPNNAYYDDHIYFHVHEEKDEDEGRKMCKTCIALANFVVAKMGWSQTEIQDR